MTWTRIALATDLQDDEVVAFEVGEAKLALFRSAGEFFVTGNVCTHQQALLSDGYVEDGCVECPLHEARFDLRTGKVLCAPATKDIAVYPVRVDADGIFADV